MKFEVDGKDYKYTPLTREELVEHNNKFFKNNLKSELGNKKTLPLSVDQKNYLSDYCKNLEYSKKSSIDKEDLGVYKSGNVHKVAQDDENMKEILKVIEQHTYPYGRPIERSWCKWYGKSSFIGLHTDPFRNEEGKTAYVSSIMVYKTPDLEGGELVIAGDWDYVIEKNHIFNNIMKRLKTFTFTDIGDFSTWDDKMLHGVCDIHQGERITLMVVKTEE